MTTSGYLALIVLASACAGSTPRDTLPHAYSCDGARVVVAADVATSAAMTARLASRGDDADRYVAPDGTELVVPHDHMDDATVARGGVRSQCIAHAGYTDVLSRYLHAETMHAVAVQLQLPDADVRGRIFAGWTRLGTRYRRER